jgi:two-component sensor histidine kinase
MKSIIHPLVVFFLSFSFTYGQGSAVDSLEGLLTTSINDSTRIEIYNQLRRATIYAEPDKARTYIEKAIELAKKNDFLVKEGVHTFYLGNFHFQNGSYSQALTQYLRAEEIFEEKELVAYLPSVYNGIASAYQFSGSDSLTLKYFIKSRDLAQKNNDAFRLAIAQVNISNHLLAQENKVAEAIAVLETVDSLFAVAKTIKPELNTEDYRGMAYGDLGKAYYRNGEASRAKEVFSKSLDLGTKSNNNLTITFARQGLGRILADEGNYRGAASQFNAALKVATDNGFLKERQEILFELSRVNRQLGNYRQGLASLQEAYLLRDTIFNEEKDKNLNQALQAYEAEKKNQQIELLEQENELNELRVAKANRDRLILLGGLLAISLLLLSVWRNNKLKQKANQKLEEKNAIIEKALEEKNLLLKEIHHRVKNNLQVISSLLSLQSRYIKDANALDAINEGRSRVQSMALLHKKLYREDNLKGVDMKSYYDDLIDNLFDAYNIDPTQVILKKDIKDMSLDIDTVIPLGLITNELISNALKHAFPDGRKGEVTVQLSEINEELVLRVSDNGVGMGEVIFGSDQNNFGNHMVGALAHKLDATISSVSDSGTTVSVFIKKYQKAVA